MIGRLAFLEQLIFPGLSSILLIISATLWWRSRERPSVKFVVASALFLAGLVVGSVRFKYQLREHQILENLKAAEVSRIQIGGTSYSEKREISAIVAALNNTQWFSSNHGGWAREVPMTINLNSGKVIQQRVALYLREPGAVVLFVKSKSGGGESRYGYAFSEALPKVLASTGTQLPSSTP